MKKALVLLTLLCSLLSLSKAQVVEGFEDEFIDHSAWTESNNENSFCKVIDGKYILEHKRTSQSWLYTKSLYLDPNKDFYIETKMTQLSGVSNDGYGIIFGMSGIQNYYSFVVSSDGKYKLYGYRNNEFFSPQEWTKGNGINKRGTANILAIRKTGNTISFFVNGNLLYTQTYQPFFGLSIGFVLNRKMKVAVDYIKVKQSNTINRVKESALHYKKENLGA